MQPTHAETPTDRLLPLDEVADRLACSVVTVRRLCRPGPAGPLLGSVKHGKHRRVLESELCRYIGSLPASPATAPAEGITR